MSGVPDIGPDEVRTFAEAEQAQENLPGQIARARGVLRNYFDVLASAAPAEEPPTARERAAHEADQPDLHPKA
jgi:hypothetical protein